MANTGIYKHLPWPEDFWAEAFSPDDNIKLPEDWETSLALFTDSLTKLEKQILYGWYRDKKTDKQLEAELKCTGVKAKKSAIIRKLRSDWANRNIYLYGMAKAELMSTLHKSLVDGLGFSSKAAKNLTSEIIRQTSITQMTCLEHEVSDAILSGKDKQYAVEVILNKYGLTMLKTSKKGNYDHCRECIFEEALEIIQRQNDHDELAECIAQTIQREMGRNLRTNHLIAALASGKPSTIFNALTGGDALSLLCKAGVVVLNEAEHGTVIWGEVQRANTLPPITEEEQ